MIIFWEFIDVVLMKLRQYIYIPPRPPVKLPFYARGFEAQLNAALENAWNACFWAGFGQGAMFFGLGYLLLKELLKKKAEKDKG